MKSLASDLRKWGQINHTLVEEESMEDYFFRYGHAAAILLGATPHGATWDHPGLAVVTNEDSTPLSEDYFLTGRWTNDVEHQWWVNYHMALVRLHGEILVYDNGRGEPLGGVRSWWWLEHTG